MLVKFRSDVSEQAIADLWAGLAALPKTIEGMGAPHAGESVSPEQIERGYKHGFSIDFETMEALQIYLDHPKHQEFGARLLALTQGGLGGILVFDLPL